MFMLKLHMRAGRRLRLTLHAANLKILQHVYVLADHMFSRLVRTARSVFTFTL